MAIGCGTFSLGLQVAFAPTDNWAIRVMFALLAEAVVLASLGSILLGVTLILGHVDAISAWATKLSGSFSGQMDLIRVATVIVAFLSVVFFVW